MAYAHWAAGKDQQPDQSDQAHGLQLPEQQILFHENQERLTRQSVKNFFVLVRNARDVAPLKTLPQHPPVAAAARLRW